MSLLDEAKKQMLEAHKDRAAIRDAVGKYKINQKVAPLSLMDNILLEQEKQEAKNQPSQQGGTGTGEGALPPMAMPDIVPIPGGGDMGQAAAINNIVPTPSATQPDPRQISGVEQGSEHYRPGFVGTVSQAPRQVHPSGFGRYTPKPQTSYVKNLPLIKEHATTMAYEQDLIERGESKSGDNLSKAYGAARAELGPMAAESIGMAKRDLAGMRRGRVITEKAQREGTFEAMTKNGYSPGLSLKYTQAKTLGEKATLLRESGELPTGVEADRLLIKIRNVELGIKRRADMADENVQLRKQMQLQRQGLVGFLGLRATPEEVGQTLTEAQNAFRAVMAAGAENSTMRAMLPQIQGNISKLSGDDWMLTKKPGFGADKYEPYKTNEILIKFAEADGTWVEKGLNREQALEKRRAAAAWLEKIHGMPTHDEDIVDGRLEFSWGATEGPNSVRLNELLNTQRDHQLLEDQHGMIIRDFAPSAYARAVRKEPDLGDPTTDEGFYRTPEQAEAQPYIYPHKPPTVKQTLDTKERLRRGLKTFIYGNEKQEK